MKTRLMGTLYMRSCVMRVRLMTSRLMRAGLVRSHLMSVRHMKVGHEDCSDEDLNAGNMPRVDGLRDISIPSGASCGISVLGLMLIYIHWRQFMPDLLQIYF